MIYKLTIATELIEGWAKTNDIFKNFDVRFKMESDLPENAILFYVKLIFDERLELYFKQPDEELGKDWKKKVK